MRDVGAIVVDIAAIDPRSKVLLRNDQIAILGGGLADFTTGSVPGQFLTQWQTYSMELQVCQPGDFRYSGVRALFLSYPMRPDNEAHFSFPQAIF